MNIIQCIIHSLGFKPELIHVGSPGIVTKVYPLPRVLFVPQSYRSHRSSGLGYGDFTELTEIPGTVRKCYRTHRSSGYCGMGVQNSHTLYK